jgi:hypothetical protein
MTNLLEAKQKGVTKAVEKIDRLPLAISRLMKERNESVTAMAESYGIDHKTLAKWRKGKCPSIIFVALELLYTDENLS